MMLSGKLKEEVHCPGCQQLFRSPLLLPCGHNICTACANRLWFSMSWPGKSFHVSTGDDAVSEADSGVVVCSTESNGSLNQTPLLTTVTHSPQSLRESCPSCTVIPKLPIDNLTDRYQNAQDWWPRNVALENLIARLSELNTSTKMGQGNNFEPRVIHNCQLCESGRSASSYCQDCQLWYCTGCFAKWHPTSGLLARHQVKTVPISESSKTPGLTEHPPVETVHCREHPAQSCHLYCLNCCSLICTHCLCVPFETKTSSCPLEILTVSTSLQQSATVRLERGGSDDGSFSNAALVTGPHSGHLICSANVQAKRFKTDITKHLHKLSNLAKDGGELVHELKSTATRIKQSAQTMEAKLNKQIDQLIQVIERRRTVLLDDLRSQLQHRGRRLRDQSNQIGSRLSATTSLIHFAVELLKEQDPSAFIQILPSLQRRLSSAEDQFKTELDVANQTKVGNETELRINTDSVCQQLESLRLEEHQTPPVPVISSSDCQVDGNALFIVWRSPHCHLNGLDPIPHSPTELPQLNCPLFSNGFDSCLSGSLATSLALPPNCPYLNGVSQNGPLGISHFKSTRLTPQQLPGSVSAYHLSDRKLSSVSNGDNLITTPFGSRKTLSPSGSRYPEMNSSQSMNTIHPPSNLVIRNETNTGTPYSEPRIEYHSTDVNYSLEVDNGRGGAFKVAYTGPETACRLEGLQFNTPYRLRVRAMNFIGESAPSAVIQLRTARLATFRIDPSSGRRSPHANVLHIDPDGLCVQALGDVEDHVLLANIGFSHGTHYWEWRIEAYNGRGQPSFGVALNSVARNRMLGFDNAGWAMYANSNRSWFLHAGQHRDRTDGGIRTTAQLEQNQRDQQPTVIGVRIDCDQGHLGFYLNGEPHGPIAFTDLLQIARQSDQVTGSGESGAKTGSSVVRPARPTLFFPALSLSHHTRVRLITGLEVPSESEESSEDSEAECGVSLSSVADTSESTSSFSTPNNTCERPSATGKDSSPSPASSINGSSKLRHYRSVSKQSTVCGTGFARGCPPLSMPVSINTPKSPTPIRLVTFGRS